MAEQDFTGVQELSRGGLPDFALDRRTALMIIDMQKLDAHREHGMGRWATDVGALDEVEYYFRRVEDVVIPAIADLLGAFRAARLPIIHTRVRSQDPECRDASRRQRALGIVVPPGSVDAEFLDELAPLPGEIVLDKVTSGAFCSTQADYLLRCLGVRSIVLVGVVTNNCVESTAREAADLGYDVALVQDGCAAWTDAGHQASIQHLHRNFVVARTSDDVVKEIAAL